MFTSGLLAITSIAASADHHMESAMQFAPVEMMECSYNEDKDAEDLKALTDAFTAWVQENDKDYTYWMLWPQFREGSSEWDVGLLGAWTDGAGFGGGYDAWVEDDDDVGDMFSYVLTCNNSLAAVTQILVPEGGDDWEAGTVWFQRCEREEGVRLSDAVAAHREASMATTAMGAESASWAFVPALGAGDPDFDYYHVESWPSYGELGESFDNYFNKGGWQDVEAPLRGRVSCATPNLYRFRLMHASGS
jgi:hypothetical protein